MNKQALSYLGAQLYIGLGSPRIQYAKARAINTLSSAQVARDRGTAYRVGND